MARLVGDVGGTNTRLALFERGAVGGAPEPRFQRTYSSRTAEGLSDLVRQFLEQARSEGVDTDVDLCCIGIAGPVRAGVCRATNLPWVVDERDLEALPGIGEVRLVNDFALQSLAVTVLSDGDYVQIGGGAPNPDGPIVVVGPGTGLGVGIVLPEGPGRWRVLPSEGGHVEFAPQTPLECGLRDRLAAKFGGRVSAERVISGPGLADIAAYLTEEPALGGVLTPDTRAALAAADEPERIVGERGASGRDPVCRAAMHLFASALGAFAGDRAIALLAEGGVYLAGGIPPRFLDFWQRSNLRGSFEAKGRFRSMMEGLPLRIVTRDEPGLLGALHFTDQMQLEENA